MVKMILLTVLLGPLLMGFTSESSFDETLFLKNGPYQQGSVLIDRSKLQTVVTWCSPTLLQMRVYEEVSNEFSTNYKKLKGKDHPLQVSVAVFPPELPFDYASNYSTPTLAMSVCSPANILTTLASVDSTSTDLAYDLATSFEVKSEKTAVVAVNCDIRKAGFLSNQQYKKSSYGKTGGLALIPAGETATITSECQIDGFSIKMN